MHKGKNTSVQPGVIDMGESKLETDDDVRRILEVLTDQVASMRSELEEFKSEIKEEKSKVETEPETEPQSKEEVIEYMKKLPGIGMSKAQLLYDSGFDSTEKLKTAKPEDFSNVTGFGTSMSIRLCESIKALESGELEAKAKEEAAKAASAAESSTAAETGEKTSVTGSVGNFFKGTYGKIMGFFKGKKPAGESGGTMVEPEVEAETPFSTETAEEKDKVEPSAEVTEIAGEEAKPEIESTEGEGIDKPAGEAEPGEPKTEDKPEPETDKAKVEAPEPPKEGDESLSGLEEPVEISGGEPEVLTKDDVIKAYCDIPGVSEATATKLYDAGYESMDELREAEEDDLKMVDGIGPKTAETISKALKSKD